MTLFPSMTARFAANVLSLNERMIALGGRTSAPIRFLLQVEFLLLR